MPMGAATERALQTARGPIALLDRATPDLLAELPLDGGLGAFGHYSRHAADIQGRALQRLAGVPDARVLLAVHEGRMVAFLTFQPADREIRWGREPFPELVELGGIEVSRGYRGQGVAQALMGLAFGEGEYADRIVYATGYTWCWDLETTGLSKSIYRERILGLFKRFDFQEQVTDEPNIRFDWCNVLMVRVGPRVRLGVYRRFLDLLFERPSDLDPDRGGDGPGHTLGTT